MLVKQTLASFRNHTLLCRDILWNQKLLQSSIFLLDHSDWKYLRMADEAEILASENPEDGSPREDASAERDDVIECGTDSTVLPGGGSSDLYQAPIQEYSEEFGQDIEAMKAMGLPLSFTNRQAIDLDEVCRLFMFYQKYSFV